MWDWWQNSTSWFTSRFDKKKKNNGLTDKESQTDDFNVIRESYNENVRSHFTDHVISSNELCNHYTGFPSVVALNPDFEYLDHGNNSKKVVLYNYQKWFFSCWNTKKVKSYILTLARLTQNFDLSHLCFLYRICGGTVSNTTNTWINYMYLRLGLKCIWWSRQQIAKIIPSSMKEKYQNVRCIIKCVEFKIETPSSLVLHIMMYSD